MVREDGSCRVAASAPAHYMLRMLTYAYAAYVPSRRLRTRSLYMIPARSAACVRMLAYADVCWLRTCSLYMIPARSAACVRMLTDAAYADV